jgi:hypothetical protein
VGQFGLFVEAVVLGVFLGCFAQELALAAGLPLGVVHRGSSLVSRL